MYNKHAASKDQMERIYIYRRANEIDKGKRSTRQPCIPANVRVWTSQFTQIVLASALRNWSLSPSAHLYDFFESIWSLRHPSLGESNGLGVKHRCSLAVPMPYVCRADLANLKCCDLFRPPIFLIHDLFDTPNNVWECSTGRLYTSAVIEGG